MSNDRLRIALEYCAREELTILSFDLYSDMIYVQTKFGGNTYIRIEDLI